MLQLKNYDFMRVVVASSILKLLLYLTGNQGRLWRTGDVILRAAFRVMDVLRFIEAVVQLNRRGCCCSNVAWKLPGHG